MMIFEFLLAADDPLHINTRLEPMSRRLKEKSNATGFNGLGLMSVCRDWSAIHQNFENKDAQWEKRTEKP
jgi:hypothetical protein